ncbi:MAG: hypothetical protein ACLRMM_08935, partial [Ruminococcus callidus]|uniref:hypothetical protein n=2 Tax=Ruminococcus callidus TaxID=40519 RepID=UPI0039A3C081
MEPIIKINFSTQNRFQHFPFTSVCLHLFMKIVRSNDSPFLSFFGASSTLTLLDLPLFFVLKQHTIRRNDRFCMLLFS